MKKIALLLGIIFLAPTFNACRDTPLDTPQEERGGGPEGELGDDGAMDVD